MPAGVETARDLVGPAIAGWVDRLSPEVAHRRRLPPRPGRFRRAGRHGQHWRQREGAAPRARPAVGSRGGRGAGARRAAAAAVEFVHNFSLLHDDIMDGDTERRHRPTAWTVFGVGAAILAGDALLALAQDILLEDPAPQAVWASRCLSAAVQRLIAGQGADLAFEQRNDVTLVECLEMAGDKTAALMACACSIGAIHVGAPAGLAMGLAGFGAHAGLAFQLTDDLLGIWGAPAVTGKPVRSDLRARKKSLPVVAALTSGNQAGSDLTELLEQRSRSARRTCCGRLSWSRRRVAGSGPRPRPTRSWPRPPSAWPRRTCPRTSAGSSPGSPNSSRRGSGDVVAMTRRRRPGGRRPAGCTGGSGRRAGQATAGQRHGREPGARLR